MAAPVASTSRAVLPAPTSEAAVLDPQVYSLVESARLAIRECVTGAEAETDGSPLDGRQLKTCAPCKTVKVRCSGSPGETCQRCATKGILCEYPQARKLGRRATNRKTLKLYDLQRDIDRLHLLLTRRSALPPHVASKLPSNVRSVSGSGSAATADESDEHDEDDDPLLSVLSNPLGLLTLTDEPVSTPSTSGPDSEMGTTDVFQHVLDSDLALDPIHLGLLTESDFERLLTLWFDHLQQYLFLLDPALHTPMFLRRTSPFLTTVIACVVAPFDPRSAHRVDALVQHANYLSARVFTHGFKSLEVVLAYCLWAPWSPVSKVPAADRTWSYISQASRLASEIRLDLPLQPAVIEQYERLLHPFPVSRELLERTRSRIQETVFCIDLAASSQTGRIQLMMSVHGTQALAACSCMATGPEARSRLSKPAAKILDLHVSNLLISQLFAKALILHSTLQRRGPGDTRDPQAVFNDSWKRDFAEWDRQFAHVKELPYLSRLNRHILLLSYSLHFPGRVQPILEECRQTAFKAAQYVQEWLAADHGLVYASNFTITNIAYSANFLLRISHKASAPGATSTSRVALDLCRKTADALGMIGAARHHGRSTASLYADQLRALLDRLGSPAPAPAAESANSALLPAQQPDHELGTFAPPATANRHAFCSVPPMPASDPTAPHSVPTPVLSAPVAAVPPLDAPAQTPLPDWFATEQSFEQLFSWMPMSTDEWDVFSGLGGAAGGSAGADQASAWDAPLGRQPSA
ncbi:uncharacterized protein JCM10292_005079 [Rhodotorula paludigena]|uniref:uncharacterized protein n=1 Tax=Rhodotorula paludigena TaxID=86838 RepID=UPI003178C633